MTSTGIHIGLVQATGKSGGGVYNYTVSMVDALNCAAATVDLTLLRWSGMTPIPRERFHSRWRFVDLPDAIKTLPAAIKPFLHPPGLMLECVGVNRPAFDFLDDLGLDLLIHPVPHPFAFECGKPFLMAIHDLQHKLQPHFPEVSADGQWGYREYLYGNGVRYSHGLLVDSAVGKEDVLTCYPNIAAPEKIHILPFAPAVGASPNLIGDSRLRSAKAKYRLPDRFLFYPAQFWLHKNHARLVQALHELKAVHGLHIPVVLVGSKRGLPYEQREQVFDSMMELADRSGIGNLVRYLGYVPDEDMPALYSLADALVMPTFFGPTNIPIYEAWEFGCPVITSDIRGVREQVADAGLLVDPCEPRSIADGIRTLWTDEVQRRELAGRGRSRLRMFSRDAFRARVLDIVGHLSSTLHSVSREEAASGKPVYHRRHHTRDESLPGAPLSGETRKAEVRHPMPEPLTQEADSPVRRCDERLPAAEPGSQDLRDTLFQLRERLARWYLACDEKELRLLHAGQGGKFFRSILRPRRLEASPPETPSAVKELLSGLKAARSADARLKHVMGLMLFLPALQLAGLVDIGELPKWFHEDFLRFMLTSGGAVPGQTEPEDSCRQLRRQLEGVHRLIAQKAQEPMTHTLAMTYCENASFLPFYFTHQPLRPLMARRSEILIHALRHRGCELNWRSPERRAASGRVRVGIYARSICPCPETFATLPVFEYLDRSEFELSLYVQRSDANPTEERSRRYVDRFTLLPESVNQSAALIRSDDLDCLFFANNLTGTYGPSLVLAAHRLARNQLIHFCNPVTSGLPHVDYFLIGSLMAEAIRFESEFTESALIVEGSGMCFSLEPTTSFPASAPSRRDLNISPRETVYISGANWFKITPGLCRTWARILQGVPDSVLVLYPFGPAWSADYPKTAFVSELTHTLQTHGVAGERLVVLDTLKGREQVLALNQIADIYLDAIPYSGATSLLDPLSAGLPPIVVEGAELRFAQGAVLMRELGIPELVARNEDEYLRLAVRVGTDACLRDRLRSLVRDRMNAGPNFLNPRLFGRRLSRALLNLCSGDPRDTAAPGHAAQMGIGASGMR